jgi:hypothetical protein
LVVERGTWALAGQEVEEVMLVGEETALGWKTKYG